MSIITKDLLKIEKLMKGLFGSRLINLENSQEKILSQIHNLSDGEMGIKTNYLLNMRYKYQRLGATYL